MHRCLWGEEYLCLILHLDADVVGTQQRLDWKSVFSSQYFNASSFMIYCEPTSTRAKVTIHINKDVGYAVSSGQKESSFYIYYRLGLISRDDL